MTDLTIINAALTATGNEPITGLAPDDLSIAAAIAAENYELRVRGELSNYPWKRATKIIELDRLDPTTMGDPPEPWTAAYQLPTDLIEIRTVKVAGYPISYEVHGNTIVCDAATTDEVILHYLWRPAESSWPPWFRMGMIYRIEAMFLRGISELYAEAKTRDAAADEQFKLAKNRDTQSQPSRDPTISPTIEARRGRQLRPTIFR